MRRLIEVAAFVATAAALIATGPTPRADCTPETVTLQAETTCGASGPVVLTSAADCTLVAAGGADVGLPAQGSLAAYKMDAGIRDGFYLHGRSVDGGSTQCATGAPDAGDGFAIRCGTDCTTRQLPDAGIVATCAATCEGTLRP